MTKTPFSASQPPREAFVLLNCHSLEDFPTHLNGQDASATLTAWTAVWHPQLVAWTGKMPDWKRADSPPEDLDSCIVLVPGPAESSLPIGTNERAVAAEHCLLLTVKEQSRQEIEALTQEHPSECDRIADFYALGYAYLQVQLMTRQLRYSSNLDEAYFEEQIVAAAKAWADGNDEATNTSLHNCFDLIAQERDHSFSSDPYLIDLTLLAETTLGEPLASAVSGDRPTNFLANANLLEQLKQEHPQTFQNLTTKIAEDRVGLCGGMLDDQVSLDMMSLSAAFNVLQQAKQRYVDLIGRHPHAFGRFSGGLPADLPTLISGLGYEGAVFADFASGADTSQEEAKLMWQSGDSELQAICATPLDASQPDVFLGLGPRLGEAVDAGQVATALLVHWPGYECFAYEDLRRASQWGLALGKFQTLGEYFDQSERPYHSFEPSRGTTGSDPLQAAVQTEIENPLSSIAQTTQHDIEQETLSAYNAFESLLASSKVLHTDLGAAQASLAQRLGLTLASDETKVAGKLLLNPASAAARCSVSLPGNAPAPGGAIYASHTSESDSVAIADIPACGFSLVPCAEKPTRGKWFRSPKPLASDQTLRNDFIEVTLHPDTGGVLSIHTIDSRTNRFSMQLVGSASDRELKTSMVCNSTRVVQGNPVCGIIQCEGELQNQNNEKVATFQIRYQLELGSRFLKTEIELDPISVLQSSPWQDYFAARIAWAMESSVPQQILRDQLRTVSERNVLSPMGVVIDEAGPSTLVLSDALPAHRRIGTRMLDTLLLVQGERARTFDLAYGFDVKNPVAAAKSHLVPPGVLPLETITGPPTGWLFHVDSPTVVASDWSCESPESDPSVCVSLCETAGKNSRVRLRSYRDIASAEIVDMVGNKIRDAEPEGDSLPLSLSGHQIVRVKLRLK